MDKPTSTPSSANHEASKGSKFRTTIFLVLAGIAIGGSGYLIGRSKGVKQCKSDIARVCPKDNDSSAVSPKPKKTASFPPAKPLLSSSESGLTCEPMGDDDIQNRAHQIETEKRHAIANDLIERFCISHEPDKEALMNAVFNGYTEIGGIGLIETDDGKWEINLQRNEGDSNSTEMVRLEKEPPDECKPALSDEEIAQKNKEKKITEDLKAGKIEDYLKQFDPKAVLAEARALGIEDDEFIKEFVRAIKKAKSIKNNMNINAKRKLACELEFLVMSMKEKRMSSQSETKIDGSNLPIADFEDFVGAYFRSLGLKGDDIDGCIPRIIN